MWTCGGEAGIADHDGPSLVLPIHSVSFVQLGGPPTCGKRKPSTVVEGGGTGRAPDRCE